MSKIKKHMKKPGNIKYITLGVLTNTQVEINEIKNNQNGEKTCKQILKELNLDNESLEERINESIKNPELEKQSFTSIGFSYREGFGYREDEYKVRLTTFLADKGMHLLKVLSAEDSIVKTRLSFSSQEIYNNYIKENKTCQGKTDFQVLKRAYQIIQLLNNEYYIQNQ